MMSPILRFPFLLVRLQTFNWVNVSLLELIKLFPFLLVRLQTNANISVQIDDEFSFHSF